MPGSSNFQQWNPTAANQENDATYTSDTLRANGATTAAILPSTTFNKFAYQTSIFIAAFAQALANKGLTLSDANYANLVAALSNVKIASEFLSAIQVVPYATSIAFNAGVSASFDLTLTGNVASSSISNTTDGQLLLFVISQDATGGRTFAWPASGLSGGGAVCPYASSSSLQMFLVRPASTGGGIVAVTPMVWVTSSGLTIPTSTVVPISATGTVSSAYPEITEKVDASSGNITRNFYPATQGRIGWKINLKKMDATSNTVTAQPSGGQLIDGAVSNYALSRQYDALTFQCDGSGWVLI